MRSGRAIPPRLLEPPPEVNPGLALYMEAFWALCSDRHGDGHRIPWTSVQRWCEARGLDREEWADVHHLVGRVDLAYLEWLRTKQKKPAKDNTKEPTRKR